jgi:hypothetical protein
MIYIKAAQEAKEAGHHTSTVIQSGYIPSPKYTYTIAINLPH